MQEVDFSITPLGDSGLIIDFGNRIEAGLNKKVIAISRALSRAAIAGVRDIVPAYSSIMIRYDITKTIREKKMPSVFSTLQNIVTRLVKEEELSVVSEVRKIRIPVCYAPTFGIDLDDVAAFAAVSVPEVIRIHTSKIYRVYLVGFLPGFAYMGEVDERIAMPRRSEPRQQIVAGSVGIAGRQTGIYPLASPGGWQIIGRTPVKLFDKSNAIPVLFEAGDEVAFFSITEDEFNSY